MYLLKGLMGYGNDGSDDLIKAINNFNINCRLYRILK